MKRICGIVAFGIIALLALADRLIVEEAEDRERR